MPDDFKQPLRNGSPWTLLISTKIVGSPCQDFGIIFYLANCQIAFLTEKTTDAPGGVRVINCQTLDLSGSAVPISFRSIAKGAETMLACKHLIILRYSQIELLAEFALSSLLGVPYVLVFLPCVRFLIFFSIYFSAGLALASDTKSVPRAAVRGKGSKRLCFEATSALFCLTWFCYFHLVSTVILSAYFTPGMLAIVVLSISSKIGEWFYLEASVTLFLGYTGIHSKGHSLLSRPGLLQVALGQHHVYPDYSTKPLYKQVYSFFEVEGEKR
jgi:hypothetical protein